MADLENAAYETNDNMRLWPFEGGMMVVVRFSLR